MDRNLQNKKSTSKMVTILVIIAIGVAIYFLYKGFFTSSDVLLNNASNEYVSKMKIGQYVDLINKENISFKTNIDNELLNNTKDFSVEILPSEGLGRKNPCLQ